MVIYFNVQKKKKKKPEGAMYSNSDSMVKIHHTSRASIYYSVTTRSLGDPERPHQM